MKNFILILLIVSGFTFGCKEKSAVIAENIEVVTPEEMKELTQMEGVQLIDVRTPGEYDEGFIEGFQNIDFMSDSFQDDIEKLDKTKPVIVYCKSGNRSGRCSKLMLEKGFQKIYDLGGGIEKWKLEGNELKLIP